ncbi:MAG TPA: outer membrane protein transport protein [Kofleriaceae bacterium]|nr:outer membrane protein transport protein [Kofleriaceae bacterium]
MKNIRYILFAAALGSSAVASANAFNINEHDARVTGRGGATVATNTTPSAMVFNPGGLAVEEGTNAAVNGTIYVAEGSYTPDGSTMKTTTDSAPALVPTGFVTTRINKMFAVGIGVHFPFGLAVSWPTGHAQSDVIQDQDLKTYFITPSFGVNLYEYVPGLSVGGGIDIVPATVRLQRSLPFGDTTGTVMLGGDALGIGGRFGVMYHPPSVPKLKLGAMWRSDVNLDFSGKGDFDVDPTFRSQLPPDGDISTSITLPQAVTAGVAYDVLPQLQLEFDAVWTNWSKFNELRIKLPDGSETVTPENYENKTTLRFGGEYTFTSVRAALRGGFIYDPTPIPTTTLTAQLPDYDRKNITIGGSYYFGNYGAHLGLLWVTHGERETSDALYMPVFKANYGVDAFVASAMVSGSFGK